MADKRGDVSAVPVAPARSESFGSGFLAIFVGFIRAQMSNFAPNRTFKFISAQKRPVASIQYVLDGPAQLSRVSLKTSIPEPQ